MGINLTTRKFKESIVAAVNGSQLPPCIISSVLRETLSEVQNVEEQQIANEIVNEMEESKEKEEKVVKQVNESTKQKEVE